MAQYIITYIGGKQPSTPEEGQAHFAKYQQWMQEFSNYMVSPANPLKDTHTISADKSVSQGSHIAMSGYTIITADSIDKAIEIAQTCPFLDLEGSLEVSELIEMNME